MAQHGYCFSGWPDGLQKGAISNWPIAHLLAVTAMFINKTITLEALGSGIGLVERQQTQAKKTESTQTKQVVSQATGVSKRSKGRPIALKITVNAKGKQKSISPVEEIEEIESFSDSVSDQDVGSSRKASGSSSQVTRKSVEAESVSEASRGVKPISSVSSNETAHASKRPEPEDVEEASSSSESLGDSNSDSNSTSGSSAESESESESSSSSDNQKAAEPKTPESSHSEQKHDQLQSSETPVRPTLTSNVCWTSRTATRSPKRYKSNYRKRNSKSTSGSAKDPEETEDLFPLPEDLDITDPDVLASLGLPKAVTAKKAVGNLEKMGKRKALAFDCVLLPNPDRALKRIK